MASISTIKNWQIIALLVATGFFVYAVNTNNPLFWDDEDWILNNPYVHRLSLSNTHKIFSENVLAGIGLESNYYRPVLLLSFAVNYKISGEQSWSYHVVNNLVHALNAVLIFLILKVLTRRRLVAFLTALLFLIHPLQTEAVTYISGRGDPLSVFFVLLSIWFFIQFHYYNKKTFLFASVVWLVLGILSRETAVLVPALMSLIILVFLGAGGLWTRLQEAIKKTWLHWSLVVGYMLLRLTALNFNNTLNFYNESNAYTDNILYRLFTFSHALVEYFKLLFVPLGLHMEREISIHTSLFQWPVWFGLAIVTGIIGAGIYFYWKENPKHEAQNSKHVSDFEFRISNFRIWVFGWGWFFIGLIPVSGLIPINATMYEHWLYLPMIGFWFLLAHFLVKFINHLRLRNLFAFSFSLFAIFTYFVFLGYHSYERNVAWGKPIEFYEDTLEYSPHSTRVMNNLGNLYNKKNDTEQAIKWYRKATDEPGSHKFAQPYYNLGTIYQSQGKDGEASAFFEKAILIDPSFPFAYQNLAVLYAKAGDLVAAAGLLEKLITFRQDSRVYYNLALVYIAQNNIVRAREILLRGFSLTESDPQARGAFEELLKKAP